MPDGTQGYEGTPISGFRVAKNRILWTGDAGLGASLDDMIASARHIDATRDDADALYCACPPGQVQRRHPGRLRLRPQPRHRVGREVTAHGGALRGWRSHRMRVPSERVSIVVMFNHLSDTHDAAVDVLTTVLGEERPPPRVCSTARLARRLHRAGDWALGAHRCGGDGQVRLRYGHFPERLDMQADGTASSDNGSARLRPGDGGLWMDRPYENQSSRLRPV